MQEVVKMNYQKITKCDTANGEGIRVTLWVSGCSHHCEGCHNTQTWNEDSGIKFDIDAIDELVQALDKPWIDGLTISGGDPLYIDNIYDIAVFVKFIKFTFPNKTIWCYTGYTFEELAVMQQQNRYISSILDNIDILVDGRYQKDLRDVSYPWAGSSNQRVWARVNGEWVQSKYDKEYRERLNAKSSTPIQK